MIFSGIFDFPWWGYAIAALVLTHITIVAVTVFLHRHQAHRALELHPAVSHFFRLWLWLTTGMVTKEWAAVHRKHHAKGRNRRRTRIVPRFSGSTASCGAACSYTSTRVDKLDTLERYGLGTPDDWLERNVYSRFLWSGLTLMGAHRRYPLRHRAGRADFRDTDGRGFRSGRQA